jgi:hypothetical protein
MKPERDDAGSEAGRRPQERLPYEKPAVVWEQPLEAQPSLMSGCQKPPAGGPSCTLVGPTSS